MLIHTQANAAMFRSVRAVGDETGTMRARPEVGGLHHRYDGELPSSGLRREPRRGSQPPHWSSWHLPSGFDSLGGRRARTPGRAETSITSRSLHQPDFAWPTTEAVRHDGHGLDRGAPEHGGLLRLARGVGRIASASDASPGDQPRPGISTDAGASANQPTVSALR
jgi:hypothetical protein